MANLLIEIGNTALKAAWSEGETLGKTFRYQGERTTDFILSLTEKEKPQVMTIASVRTLSSRDESLLRAECGQLILLDPSHRGLLERYGLPDHISFDRVASIIAVSRMFKGKSCSIFDFGTTLTVDFIDGTGAYKGGNISLGCRTRFKALNRYSRNLPLINTPDEIPQTGTSMASSIESGIISGIMFEVEGYMRRYPENVVVFTGGDAIYFAKQMKNSIFVVCNLSIMGLVSITDEYVKKDLQ